LEIGLNDHKFVKFRLKPWIARAGTTYRSLPFWNLKHSKSPCWNRAECKRTRRRLMA